MNDINEAMPEIEANDFAGAEYHSPRSTKAREKALEINNDAALTEAEKVDRMAEHRNWFSGDTSRIDAYLAGEIGLELTDELAIPIDHAFSTADHGRGYWREERVARSQRKYHTPEKALEMWGAEEEFDEADEQTKEIPGTEMRLWDLWYSILHASKKLNDDVSRSKLLRLIEALKNRPDPQVPKPMTIPLSRNWIWQGGKLWSVLLMLGPSAREMWNDSCGCGAGWTPIEVKAWININTFVAKMVADGVSTMFYNYGQWALGDLEVKWTDQSDHQTGEIEIIRETIVTIAAVWVCIAGEEMYKRREKDSHGVDGNEIDINKRGRNFPWIKLKHGVTTARWIFWKRRLLQEGEDESLAEEVRQWALKASKVIDGFPIDAT